MTQPHQHTHNVVLIGQLDWPQNIYLAKALHDGGFQVRMLSDGVQPKDLAHWLTVESMDLGDTAALSARIRELAEDPATGWILPLDEDAIHASHLAAADSGKLFPNIPADQRDMLQQKSAMGEFAQSVGVPTPTTVRITHDAEALKLAAQMGFPIVLKGETGFAGNTVAVCDDMPALEAALQRLARHNKLLQQHVAGVNWGCGGFFVDGELIRVHAYEIVEQTPPRCGPASKVRHASEPDLICAMSALGRALHWQGFMQADFIRDANGTFWFLEINPRPWGSMTAAVAAGNDLFAPLVDVLHGIQPQAVPQPGTEWCGTVFPKPLLSQARQRQWARVAMTLMSPRYWRSAPPTDWRTFKYFLKLAYWAWLGKHQPGAQRGTLPPASMQVPKGFT